MCGICGILGLDGAPVSGQEIRSMLAWMRHRGPDDQGLFQAPGIGLGFVRLSVLDLSTAGHQPMHSPDGRYVMVYNGEVYNYLELRTLLQARGHRFHSGTDTEVVLAAFTEWGLACLHRFNGMFAFAVYDKRDRRLVLVRDRFGVKPLYFARIGQRLAFASEIAPLLQWLPHRRMQPQAVFDYLVHERMDHTSATFFQDVVKLGHGHSLQAADGRVTTSRWYRLRDRLQEPPADAEAFLATFEDALRLTLRSDVPLGVSLSGGLDSSSIACMLHDRLDVPDVQTFSAVYGRGHPGDESAYLDLLSPRLASMHFIQPSAETLMADLDQFLAAHQEPVPRTGPYAQFKVMQLAQGRVTVTLDGQGADEMLAGYKQNLGFYFQGLLRAGRYRELAHELRHTLGGDGARGALAAGLAGMMPKRLQADLLRRQRPEVSAGWFTEYAASSPVPRLLLDAPDLRSALQAMLEHKLEHLLKWSDRNSMWFSIESRVPFLDHRLVEHTLSLPDHWIIRHGLSKYILREAMHGLLPEAIRTRRDKIGFGTPENDWLRRPAWIELTREALNSGFYRDYPIIDLTAARHIHDRHLAGRCNAARKIWKWINLYLWHRRFLSQAPPMPEPQAVTIPLESTTGP